MTALAREVKRETGLMLGIQVLAAALQRFPYSRLRGHTRHGLGRRKND
jgi:hypothetical protein